MKESYYTIVTGPIEVRYDCPHCGWEHNLTYDEFMGDKTTDDVWTMFPNIEEACEDCEKEFVLTDMDVD